LEILHSIYCPPARHFLSGDGQAQLLFQDARDQAPDSVSQPSRRCDHLGDGGSFGVLQQGNDLGLFGAGAQDCGSNTCVTRILSFQPFAAARPSCGAIRHKSAHRRGGQIKLSRGTLGNVTRPI